MNQQVRLLVFGSSSEILPGDLGDQRHGQRAGQLLRDGALARALRARQADDEARLKLRCHARQPMIAIAR